MILTALLLFSLQLLVQAQLPQVITKCTVPNTVALTLDDGPYLYNKELVDLASNNGAKLTFFVNGNNWGCIYNYAEQLKYAKSKGHQIASHTWAHKNISTLTWDQVHDEMWKVELAMQRILGAQPAFMRPPYGSYNDNVRKVAQNRGQTIVNWDFDSADSAGATPAKSKQLYTDRLNSKPSTILALNHETYEKTAREVLPFAIAEIKKKGYKMVTVAECLGKNPYQWTKEPETRTDAWKC